MKTELVSFKNGAKLLFNRQTDVNGIAIRFVFMAGALNDPVGKLGVAHFCEHALCNFSNERFSRSEIESYARKFQYRNAYTSARDMGFVLHTVDADFEDAIDFLTQSFKSIKFLPEDFAEERKIIEDEIKMKMQINNRLIPNVICTKVIDDEAYNNLVDSPSGTITTFSRITLDDLKNFKDNYITANNLVVSICGNIKKAKVIKILKKYLNERLVSSKTKGYEKRELKLQEPKVHFKKALEKGKSTILFSYYLKTIPFSFEHPRERFVSKVLSSILSERVFDFFRMKNNLCYGCNASIDVWKGHLLNDVQISCQEENLDSVIEKFGEFIETFKSDLPKELFEKHKKRVVDGYNFDLINITKLASVIEDIYYEEQKLYGEGYKKDIHEQLASVTQEEVNEMYKLLFTVKPCIIIIASEKYKNYGYSKLTYKK